jgi:pSer/pThr/pTyr-binding forkhead associated (FHA) protein
MMVGSAPKCDIYLFKDAAIEPRHASITKRGAKYVLGDEGSASGTFINGRKVERHVLQNGDIVSIGETVLKYHEKQKR